MPKITGKTKQILFILINCMVWCAIGYLGWESVGDQIIRNEYMALCFIGYPGFFLGLVGSIIYLYNHDHS
ncbi:MAG: hypothetical protein Q4A65_00080 [Bacillota bacterium]|nr:hypothetical protein [Bacillota bacterium]